MPGRKPLERVGGLFCHSEQKRSQTWRRPRPTPEPRIREFMDQAAGRLKMAASGTAECRSLEQVRRNLGGSIICRSGRLACQLKARANRPRSSGLIGAKPLWRQKSQFTPADGVKKMFSRVAFNPVADSSWGRSGPTSSSCLSRSAG